MSQKRVIILDINQLIAICDSIGEYYIYRQMGISQTYPEGIIPYLADNCFEQMNFEFKVE